MCDVKRFYVSSVWRYSWKLLEYHKEVWKKTSLVFSSRMSLAVSGIEVKISCNMVFQASWRSICTVVLKNSCWNKFWKISHTFVLESSRHNPETLLKTKLNPLSANPTKWSNTLKQFVGKLPTNCLKVFYHFLKLALKGLTQKLSLEFFRNSGSSYFHKFY